jgi:hypothetical protein
MLELARGAVLAQRNPRHSVPERLSDIQVRAARVERQTVGEVHGALVPERRLPLGIDTPHARSGIAEPVTVRDVKVAVGSERRVVRDAEPVRGERLDASGCDFHPEHGRVLEVTHVQVLGFVVERHPQAEPARRRDLGERPTVRIEPVDLSALATAPHAALGMHGDAFRMVELRIGERAVVEDARRAVAEEHVDHAFDADASAAAVSTR